MRSVRRKHMAHFPDLSPYAYGHQSHPGVVHVGWLGGNHEYPKGRVAGQVIEKLRQLATRPTELYRGFHICELCSHPKGLLAEADWEWAKSRASNGEIRVTAGVITYAAPVLIVHYIQAHGYLPPDEFLRAVTNASPKGKSDGSPIARVFGAAGCLLFLALALKIGTESLHARSMGSLMSNWKGGTMAYQDGFKMTAVFALFALAFCYFAVRPKTNR